MYGIVCMYGQAHKYDSVYATTMTVESVNEQTDIVTLVDFNGFIWQIQGVEDWQEGDIASCLMHSKGTPEIIDDVILKVQYSGYIK